ncbi:zinc-dependent metalloprotease [Photobacterium sp. 1_MG-2023]|uniref:zinc-dependent metalloprotease n=1 Tax=Photobacterium sp. 1_MG-2023 TaxID=3062646 RepID=UPI0026E3F52F|nr:zinc-dependent metalloprotease [Photobacterium sp. 1_MG-2023]MDO6707831.1 zinc-dependent metalloprotease [Photobacterium sp. 1_MG-2023]
MKSGRFFLSLITTAILSGCGADDKAYQTEDKPLEQFHRSALKTDQLYLYLPSIGKVPRYAVSMAPFKQGEEKVVRLFYGEEGVEVREVSADLIAQHQTEQEDSIRWDKLRHELPPVILMKGKYQSYRCKEDSYGDCTNQEELNTDVDLSWTEKPFFTPDFNQFQVIERDRTDYFVFSKGCITPIGTPRLPDPSDWQGYELNEDGSLNVELEQDFQVTNSRRCLINALLKGHNQFDYSNLSFTVSHFYSLVPLDNIRSPDYEPVLYPKGDEDTFGFFANTISRPDQLGNAQLDGNDIKYLQRFNPNLATIDYHLSDSFDQNEKTRFYKQITQEVVARINPQLKRVGVPEIRLIEPSGKHSGDLRYNVINLIDDPLENGLAGYGPSAANPLTGEIVHAHVNQYAGVLEGLSHYFWEKLVTQYNRGGIVPMSTPEKPAGDVTTAADTVHARAIAETATLEVHAHTAHELTAQPYEDEASQQPAIPLDDLFQELATYHDIHDEELDLPTLTRLQDLEQQFWSENNMYSVDNLWVSATSKQLPTATVAGRAIQFQDPSLWQNGAVGQHLKHWQDLTLTQQKDIGEILTGIYYAKTLVHELGHNLGLRHNFKGSIDEPNYFTPAEAHQHGLTHVPSYSSIMDYNASIMDALSVFGMYDLAALRFAYKREVEARTYSQDTNAPQTASYISLEKYDRQLFEGFFHPKAHYLDPSLSNGTIRAALNAGELDNRWSDKTEGDQVIREFEYCTDGHVRLNSDCNKHDEGRNVAEMLAYRWQRYDDQLDYRTNRNHRLNFKESTLESYAIGRLKHFMSWREVLQTFADHGKFSSWSDQYRINHIYFKNDPGEDCSGTSTKASYQPTQYLYEKYCAVPRAVDLHRHQLIQVILQPDHLCELEDTAGEITYRPLEDIMSVYSDRELYRQGDVPRSCFHPVIKSVLAQQGFTVTAEAGRFLNSGKAPNANPKFNYVGYYDYLGYWPDKFAAMATLMERNGERRSTNRAELSLADFRGVYYKNGNKVYTSPIMKWLLQDIVLGTQRTIGTYYPQFFQDAQGNPVTARGEFPLFRPDTMVEPAPYYARQLKRYYDLPEKGEYSEISALLNIVVKFSGSDTGNTSPGTELAQYVSVQDYRHDVAGARTYTLLTGEKLYAYKENVLAYEMIGSIIDYTKLKNAAQGETPSLFYLTQKAFNDPEKRQKMDALIQRYRDVLPLLPKFHL